MMQSVALTESYFVHNSDDTDYVVIDVPISTIDADDILASILDEGNDDEIEEKNADDASYDYCDDFFTPTTEAEAENAITPPMLPVSVPVMVVPFEVDLSLVLNDDAVSVCCPSMTEDDADNEVDQCDGPKDNICNDVSGSTCAAQKKDRSVEDDVPSVIETADANGHQCVTAKETINEQHSSLVVTNTYAACEEPLFPVISSTGEKATSKLSTGFKTNPPSRTDEVNPSEKPIVANDTKNDGEWNERTSRTSNKKRRKQMKLAKRAAATAAALEKVSSVSSQETSSSKMKLMIPRRCGGKQVTPIFSMGNSVVGM